MQTINALHNLVNSLSIDLEMFLFDKNRYINALKRSKGKLISLSYAEMKQFGPRLYV